LYGEKYACINCKPDAKVTSQGVLEYWSDGVVGEWNIGMLEYWGYGNANTWKSLEGGDRCLKAFRTCQGLLFIRIDFFDENCAAVREHYMIWINAENCCSTY
jgi:hypothetical protein